ncbi:DUF4179 domain-containing protein [Candidatus Contubernalis alkaliaceticus]|uniref:DUF4179 domain-containing protein n=1 Tax=Candidatus Contubernalis alkaliaceticus TaxID=338645 RepID=UPI001F4C0803|nr:DUF4179 domain-containing protein [Candidatus Contubernalis alkalaceticus]UNC91226.1 DUF4179 domain-containing protein [Candidatus Contubernalis alkalaceticus]
MEKNFEKKINKILQEDSEIPKSVRTALDNTYSEIKKYGKKEKINMFWKKGIVAAVCILILGVLATNSSVIANIKGFLGFNDSGIERTVDEGLLQPIDSMVSNQNITISLDSYLYDSYKMAFIMTAKFEEADLLKGIDDVVLDFRVKNVDGIYIVENIPDTKPLKADNLPHIINAFSVHSYIDDTKPEVQFYFVIESIKGQIPKIENAVVEVETIRLFSSNNLLKEIDGQWDLALNEDGYLEREIVKYTAQKQSSDIEILSAVSTPTSFNVSFVLNTVIEGSGGLFQMKLISENGEEFEGQGFVMEENEGKTIITTNFRASAFHNSSKYTLRVFLIGPPEKQLLEDQTVELITH